MPSSDAEEEKVVDNEESSSSTTATVRSTQDEGAIMLPASSRLRMHRSAVRPFFCCGSELSLVSINEQQELRPFDQPRLRGLSGTEDSAESAADIQSENFCENGKAQRERILRKKYLDGFPRKMSMKSMAVKLRGKLPKRLKNVDEHGNIAGTSSGIEGECTGTAYRQTDEQTGFYSVSAASACAESECPKPSVSVPTYHAPDFSKSKAKVTKGKRRGKSKLSAGHSTSSSGGTSANSLLRDCVGDNAADKTGVRQSQGCSNGGPCSGSHKLIGSASVGALFSPAFQKQCSISNPWPPAQSSRPRSGRVDSDEAEAEDSAEEEGQYSDVPSLGSRAPYVSVHSQVDYLHCLVPRLASIANCSFYWGVMDRYEAEKLLENKPEGTFLLRDSAQDEFLFSVSFRRYGRSLHARVEQYNHKFSFDSHDPGVFADDTVCGLIEHYKDPSCCMFFEPMLTLPLNRSYPFSLLHLSRSAVVSCPNLTYDGISNLRVPKSLHSYLRYYHYKHKVRVRNMEGAAASK